MPIPSTKITLIAALADGQAFRLLPNTPGDFANALSFSPVPAWVSAITDLDGDGLAEIVVGAGSDDDKAVDAGRIVVHLGQSLGGTSATLTASAADLVIDGIAAGDLAGSSVGAIADLDGDGLAEILVGARGLDHGAATDAGAAFVVWGRATGGGVDLNDPLHGAGDGFAIVGAAAGDLAGTTIMAIGDLNGDGLAEILVGAPGVLLPDTGGGGRGRNRGGDGEVVVPAAEGAVYVVYGKGSDTPVDLNDVAAGSGGFRIVGEDGGNAIGSVIGRLADLNGDGRDEILIGVSDLAVDVRDNSGAAYVVFGKAGGSEVDLRAVAAGNGGFRILGAAEDKLGSAISGLGDVNGDGLADILVGAADANRAYVVFGKSGTAQVDLASAANGSGGYLIVGQGFEDLDAMSVTGGADFNRDGINDLVIGASLNDEGGNDAGAVYVVWGGGSGTVNLSLVAQGIGGAKVVGAAGSRLGSSVAIAPDLDGDGTADLIIGAAGSGESVYTLFTPASWQPDANFYGTDAADLIGPGFGSGAHVVGATADSIIALGGNDSIDSAGGDDQIEAGSGNDLVIAGAGNDRLDGGSGSDTLIGGGGDDIYVVDNALDGTVEVDGEGDDKVLASVNWTLAANLETLELTGSAVSGTGNAAANLLVGTAGNNTLDGGAGADRLVGGGGNDSYRVDVAGDVIDETATGGSDSVLAAIDWTLGANLEHLQLSGAARSGKGNELNNSLSGTAGDDTLDGLGGDDTMSGGAGNDFYRVDSAADVIVEAAGAGSDSVIAEVDYTLGANVDNLQLTGAARAGTGNALGNSLVGSDGDDTLDGAAGDDVLAGAGGNDTYRVDSAGDLIVEGAGGGIDTVIAAVDYVLADELENLALTGGARVGTGNAGANTLTGGAGDDTLDGGAGSDLLSGGLGDDTYLVDPSGDVVQESAGGGNDTVVAAFDYSLGENVENLRFSGEGTTGTGSDADNTISAAVGTQTLIGGRGNDSLDGAAGADTMIGGDGNDTYFVDDVGDIVVETADGGIDTVVTAFEGSIAANIENVRLTGTAHRLTGNSGNNTLSGNSGDDTLDGAEGDDLLLAGDGDDTLHSHSGSDTLSGGSGDDVYKIGGGAAHIEDFLGHDTIDASDASGDSYIDLSGGSLSHIGGQDCDLGQGGTTASPLDVQFLQDLSGSFGDDIANVRTLVPQIVGALRAVQADSRFGVSSFIDKPLSPFGAPGEWVYRMELGLTADQALLGTSYGGLTIRSGADEPEAQIEGLMQLALHQADVGFRPDSARFVVLFSDAPFHVAGNGTAAGIGTPNNGDGIADGGGAGEDYPFIAQVQAALEAANIIPIFAIANGHAPAYEALVAQLGRGAVVALTADSGNVVAAITGGLAAATTTHIEDAHGGAGNDVIKGDVRQNYLLGNGGNDELGGDAGDDRLDGADGDDSLSGGSGDDELHGGNGEDSASFSGAWLNYDISVDEFGVMTVVDRRGGSGDGSDRLDGVETIRFADAAIATAAVLNSAPVANDDALAGLLEATADSPGLAVASGNVIANDSDANLGVPGLGETLAVSAARSGEPGDALAMTAVSGATRIAGTYGSLSIAGDGSFTYSLDDAAPATQALAAGMTATEVFSYRLSDAHGASAVARLSFAIAGSDDPNAAPGGAATATLAAGAEDSAYTVSTADLLDGFSDADGDALAVSGLTASNGSVLANADGSFTITPTTNFNGAVTLNYAVVDGRGGSLAATQSYSLAPRNDAPAGAATAVLATGVEDVPYGVGQAELLAGFSDADGDGLAVAGLGTSNGTVRANPDGSFTITPTANFNGPVSLTYNVIDGAGGSVAASRSFTLVALDDAPTGAATAVLAAGIEDRAYTLAAAELLAGFGDADGDSLAVAGLSASSGSVLLNADGGFTILPRADFNGRVTLSYVVSDGKGGSVGATQAYTLAAVNDAPTGVATAVLAAGIANQPYTLAVAELLLGFADVDGDTLAVADLTASSGDLRVNADGSLTLTPASDFNGPLTLSYAVVDGRGGSIAATQNLTLAAGELLPGNDSLRVTRGLPSALDARVLLANDAFSSPAALRVTAVTNAVGADVALVDGMLVIDAAASAGSFDYTVSAGPGIAATGHVDFVAVATTALANTVEAVAADAAADLQGQGGNDTLTGSGGGDRLLGGGGADVLVGGAGHDSLNGGAGADLLVGGSGDDSYVVDHSLDVVRENDGEGIDTVFSSLTRTLSEHTENLVLTGTAAIRGSGNAAANEISGNAGANTLDGGAGADRLAGGLGNDTYLVDAAGDLVVEAAGGGIDTVRASLADYALTAEVENLVFSGLGDAVLRGNELANRLVGAAGDDTLDGGAGADTMLGGLGNDLYLVDTAQDLVSDAGGIDAVRTSLSSLVLTGGIESLEFVGSGDFDAIGNGLANTLSGADGDDSLNGGRGADRLIGGAGDDTYSVDHALDVVSENAGEGDDTVFSSVSRNLTDWIENLVLTGAANLHGSGNALANRIDGNAGANTLDGGAGADRLSGGLGNDTYHVDDLGDLIVELAGGGIDTVRTSLAEYALAAEVENLVFGGTGDAVLSGNELANRLSGGAGDDTLDGAAGGDTMLGGLGDDLYRVDSLRDVVADSGGIDAVHTTLSSFVLGGSIENLAFTGSGDFSGSGNGLANTLSGGAGNDSLSGGAAADLLIGGAGQDRLDGGSGNDTLVGGAGIDFLTGGLGADVFRFAAPDETDPAALLPDSIGDFRRQQLDRIDLTAIDADTTRDGDQAFSFVGTAEFGNRAGELRYAVSGSVATLSGDVDGDGVADFSIRLLGVTTLGSVDFAV